MSQPVIDGQSRVLILAPHPDDEALAVGGLLARAGNLGAARRVVFFTDGDNNPWPQRAMERRWRITPADRARWGQRRRAEASASLRTLGVPADAVEFLGFPDQGITPHLLAGGEDLAARLLAQIERFAPTLILAGGLDDLHPDHSAAAVILRLALERFHGGSSGIPRPALLTFAVHYRHEQTVDDPSRWFVLDLTADELETKRRAIACHTSQTYLTRQRLMSHATPQERFRIATFVSNDPAHHPVCRIERDRDQWRIDLALKAKPGAFGPVSVLMLAAPGDGTLGARLIADLPRRGGTGGTGGGGGSQGQTLPLRDLNSGATVGEARYRGGRSRGELCLPVSAMPAAPHWFVKIERRYGFFDEAGWAQLVPPAAPALPGVPAPPGVELSAAERLGSASVTAAAPRPALAAPVTCCVIPCYNVANHCGPVVREAAEHADVVVAIDDGSTDETASVLRRAVADAQARGRRVDVVSLERNGGKGAALLAAFRYALEHLTFDVLVTIDGDQQHRPADIPRLVTACTTGKATMAIGERFGPGSGPVPLRSRVGNTLATMVLRLRYPACPRDTQSGLRAFRRGLVEDIVRHVQPGRYETELQVLLLALGQQRTIAGVPIPTIYLDGNRTSHFRPFHDAWRVYKVMLSYRITDGAAVPTGVEPDARAR